MSLTMGSGPFGHVPAGAFHPDVPRGQMRMVEPFPRRMRGVFAGETVVDSARGQLFYEPGRLPRLYFPPDDVRMDLLIADDGTTTSPATGEATYWTMRAGDRVVETAAFAHPSPPPGAERIKDLIAFYWRAMDQWYEEDEPAIAHVRDPYHRVDALPTSRHVRVSVNGAILAESRRAKVIFETGLPARWYFPRGEVRAEMTPSDFHSACAYKGRASYVHVRVGDDVLENFAWYYPEPRRDAEPVRDHVAFFNERTDIDVDGERQARPGGPWADPNWWRNNALPSTV